jgi:hypothetical protein
MAQAYVLEGTWEELSVHAQALYGKKLRLIIIEDEVQGLTPDTEEARVAAIRAGMGKFADPTRKTLASEELRQERQRDEARHEQKSGSNPA